MSSIPLRAVSSARPDPDGLVPRTPHSRSGRFDEADLGVPSGTREDTDSDDLSDSDPLLKNDNDADGTPNPPLQPAPARPLTNRTRFSIVGLTVVTLLVFLLGVMYRESEQEKEVVDQAVEDEYSDIALISYENYTEFPLTPKQYRQECRKAHGGMRHMAYWTDMKMDVPHPSHSGSGSGFCKSTVTYMLGSEVGLMGELALLAQIAALADSVGPCIGSTNEAV